MARIHDKPPTQNLRQQPQTAFTSVGSILVADSTRHSCSAENRGLSPVLPAANVDRVGWYYPLTDPCTVAVLYDQSGVMQYAGQQVAATGAHGEPST